MVSRARREFLNLLGRTMRQSQRKISSHAITNQCWLGARPFLHDIAYAYQSINIIIHRECHLGCAGRIPIHKIRIEASIYQVTQQTSLRIQIKNMRAINQRWNKDHRRTRSLGMDELCRTFRPNTRQQRPALRFAARFGIGLHQRQKPERVALFHAERRTGILPDQLFRGFFWSNFARWLSEPFQSSEPFFKLCNATSELTYVRL